MVARLAVNYCSSLRKLRDELSGITVEPLFGQYRGNPDENRGHRRD